MKQIPSDLKRRLLTILHLGFVEVRNLSSPEHCEQLFDLADAMEFLPQFVEKCTPDDMETILQVLQTYEKKYPGRSSLYDYSKYLHAEIALRDFWAPVG